MKLRFQSIALRQKRDNKGLTLEKSPLLSPHHQIMANQIGPHDHNASDWFRAKKVARAIVIIFIYIPRAAAIPKKNLNWWTTFNCRTGLMGYGLLIRKKSNFIRFYFRYYLTVVDSKYKLAAVSKSSWMSSGTQPPHSDSVVNDNECLLICNSF